MDKKLEGRTQKLEWRSVGYYQFPITDYPFLISQWFLFKIYS